MYMLNSIPIRSIKSFGIVLLFWFADGCCAFGSYEWSLLIWNLLKIDTLSYTFRLHLWSDSLDSRIFTEFFLLRALAFPFDTFVNLLPCKVSPSVILFLVFRAWIQFVLILQLRNVLLPFTHTALVSIPFTFHLRLYFIIEIVWCFTEWINTADITLATSVKLIGWKWKIVLVLIA